VAGDRQGIQPRYEPTSKLYNICIDLIQYISCLVLRRDRNTKVNTSFLVLWTRPKLRPVRPSCNGGGYRTQPRQVPCAAQQPASSPTISPMVCATHSVH
jgi:hypothetical protein